MHVHESCFHMSKLFAHTINIIVHSYNIIRIGWFHLLPVLFTNIFRLEHNQGGKVQRDYVMMRKICVRDLLLQLFCVNIENLYMVTFLTTKLLPEF